MAIIPFVSMLTFSEMRQCALSDSVGGSPLLFLPLLSVSHTILRIFLLAQWKGDKGGKEKNTYRHMLPEESQILLYEQKVCKH